MTTKTMSPLVEQQFKAVAASGRQVLVDNMLTESAGLTSMAVLEEESKTSGALIVEGKVGQCGAPTANKRLYERRLMEREVTRLLEKIERRALLASVDHPTDGKCLGKGTPVLLADGRVLPVEEIVTGDRLMGPDGKVRTVLSTTTGTGKLYRIDPNKGESWVCNDAHMLTLSHTSTHELIDISVEEWVNKGAHFQSRYKLVSVGVERFDNEIDPPKIDPYFLGVWIGDGSKSTRRYADGEDRIPSVAITTADTEIREVCEEVAARWEATLTEQTKSNGGKASTFYLSTERGQENRLLRTLRDLVGSERRIPDSIIRGSKDTRLRFLAGLLDTDGHLQNNLFYITQKREDYVRDSYRIARSLGFQAQVSQRKIKGYTDDYYVLTIWGDVDQIPTKLERKKAEPRDSKNYHRHTGFIATDIGEGEYYGFELDGDGRFLLGDFTVTHNSRIMDSGAICLGLRVEADGSVFGKYEIVEESDGGRNLAAFLRRGCQIGMSSRGVGSTRMDASGNHVVGEDFKLHGFDFVADPACKDAFPSLVAEDIDPDSVTEDELRIRFPSLLEDIESRARQVGAEVAETELRELIENEFNSGLEEAKDNIRLELLSEVREQLREDFAAKLLKALQEQRTQVEEVVRSELLSDPGVAGAKKMLEDLAAQLHPYRPAPDQKALFDDYEGKISALKEEIEARSKEIEERQAAINEMAAQQDRITDQARSLGFRLFVERAIGGHEHADQMREMIGDPAEFTSAESLRDRVQAVISQVEESQEEAARRAEEAVKVQEHKVKLASTKARVVSEELDKVRGEFSDKIEKLAENFQAQLGDRDRKLSESRSIIRELENKLSESETTAQRARRLAEDAALVAYAERRLVGHPRREDILAAVESGRLRSQDEVHQLAEQWDIRGEEPGGVSERVRRAMSKGYEAPSEEERGQLRQLQESSKPVPGLEGFDTTMGELRALCGIGQDNNGRRRF